MAKRPEPRIQFPKQSNNATSLLIIVAAALILGLIILNVLPALTNIGGCVGLIEVVGEISTTATYSSYSSSEVVGLIAQAEGRPDIQSLLIVVNSPGGSAVASRAIYSAMQSMEKPVYAYISDVGASGGYFVAVGADKIYADRGSVVGSVGARASIIDLSKLLENTGINFTTIKSGEMKDIGDISRPPTEEELALLQTLVDEIYSDFRQIVHESRDGKNSRYSSASLETISDARILTGKQAYDLGLVDALGTRTEALNAIGVESGLGENPSVCSLAIERDFLSSLVSAMGRGMGEVLVSKVKTDNLKIVS